MQTIDIYIFDICEYVSHRRNVQSMWGAAVETFPPSHRPVFPSLSLSLDICFVLTLPANEICFRSAHNSVSFD